MRTQILLATLAGMLGTAFAQTKSPEEVAIKEGIRLIFQVRNEASVRQGAQRLLEVGTAKALEPLLKVLNDPQPHFRDIAWEVLPDFKDPYARKRIEQELKTNRTNESVREWCAELLGLYRDAAFSGALLSALNDTSAGVRRAAVRSLGQLGHESSYSALERATGSSDEFVRELALEAVARIDKEKARSKYLGGLSDQDAGVRCALLGALPQHYPELVEARSVAMLADADWRPRMQAVENLGAIKTLGAVDALIGAVDDGRPAVAEKARTMLQRLTGTRLWMRPQWEAWWKEHRAGFDFAKASSRPTATAAKSNTVSTYHGIELTSDHVAFLIDCSPDMDRPLTSKGMTKHEAAIAELHGVLSGLEGRLVFNACAYAEEVKLFQKSPVALDKKSGEQALAFVKRTRLKGSKNIWALLETVVSDPTLDTVFLLSSGEPEIGLYVHWNRVTEHLKELNRFHKVVVHTVAYSDSKWYRDQLEKIAEATGGKFHGFQ